MSWRTFNKSQRMQLKALICVLGMLLLLLLLLGSLVLKFLHNGEDKEQKRSELTHIPVIEIFKNVWIMEAEEEGIQIYRDGREEKYAYHEDSEKELWIKSAREQLADITLIDGAVEEICLKTEKITGRVLSADESFVEIEGYGKLPLSEEYKGYRIFGVLSMCGGRDLSFGYSFADFVLEDGKICGILMAKEDAMEQIRVLLKTSGFKDIYHESIVLTADCDFIIQYGDQQSKKSEEIKAGQEITFLKDSYYFEGERVIVTPKILTGRLTLKNITRSQGTPSYRGHMELIATRDGIVAINQVALEEYLYCVVPSEMPVSYPEEALKAQAVCARTYAYGKMLSAGYPQYGAHVDDSTSYQVYNNTLEQARSTTAVKETYGQLLYTPEGTVAETYYYSTSCGVGSDANVWKTDGAKQLTYLKSRQINQNSMQEAVTAWNQQNVEEENFKTFITGKDAGDFEVAESWYRWTYQVKKVDAEIICEALKKRYLANKKLILTLKDGNYVSTDIKDFSKIENMYVEKRGNGGYADELVIETNKATYKVISEYNIRYVLNNGESKVVRQDGSEVASPTLLPSAFFVLSLSKEKEKVTGYTINGGGYGHGVGMSQNGAKAMANSGYNSNDILHFFYDGCEIHNVYEQGNKQ